MLSQYPLIYTHLKWVLDFLLYYPFYMLYGYSQPSITLGTEFLGTFHYGFINGSEEQVDCAVCLSKIREGDEVIRVMRCEHVFHKGCLDRWVGFKNATCPLCRGSVAPTRPVSNSGAEVLLFQFCSEQKHDTDTWWLR